MDESDDTLKPKGDVVQLSVVKNVTKTPELDDSCTDTLEQLDAIKDQILEGRLTSLVLFAITSDGEYSKVVLSKNRFEVIGLAEEIHAFVREEVLIGQDQD